MNKTLPVIAGIAVTLVTSLCHGQTDDAPKVTVTPHIASATRADTASAVIAENIRRGEAHEPFLNLVDRKAGY